MKAAGFSLKVGQSGSSGLVQKQLEDAEEQRFPIRPEIPAAKGPLLPPFVYINSCPYRHLV